MTEPESLLVPKRRRRKLTLSLRGVMIAVLIVGGLLGWKARRVAIQRRAVAEIVMVGGSVRYLDQWDGKSFGAVAKPWAPEWLRRSIGDDYFREVGAALLSDTVRPLGDADLANVAALGRLRLLGVLNVAATDAGLEPIGRLDRLEGLMLQVNPGPDRRVTGAGLAKLAGLVALKNLSLQDVILFRPDDLAPLAAMGHLEDVQIERSPVDEACLDHLVGLTRLKSLELANTELTDAGLARLARLPALTSLTCGGSGVTDAGLATLATNRGLKIVKLAGMSRVTDAGLAHLATLPALQELDLTGARITDAGLAHLAPLTRLGRLNLGRTAITDAGLAVLGGIPGLRRLDVEMTRVTPAGVAALRAARPGLEVLNGLPPPPLFPEGPP